MSKRILVLDDEPAILAAMGTYLRRQGYLVDCASDRREAERLLSTETYACTVVDVRIGDVGRGEDGLEIVTTVRGRHAGTGIVVLTAYGTPDVEAEARGRGAAGFLHKPKLLREVARVVDALVQGRAAAPPPEKEEA